MMSKPSERNQYSIFDIVRDSYQRRKPRPTAPIPHPELTIFYFANGEWHSSKMAVVNKPIIQPATSRASMLKNFKRGQITRIKR